MRSSQGTSSGRGDRDAIHSLIRSYLPLAYNIIGLALNGYQDTDRVVQAAMLEALRANEKSGTAESGADSAAFPSLLVTACVRQVRDAREAYGPRGSRPQGPDFGKLMVERLGLVGEQREIARAGRWLDDEDRLLLALWWQAEAGTVSRGDVARALRQPPAAMSRHVGQLSEALQDSRVVDRALRRSPVCGRLAATADAWDRKPSAAWRDRLADHVLDCRACLPGRVELSQPGWLLESLPLVPPPPGLTTSVTRAALRSLLGDDVPAASAEGPRPPRAGGPRDDARRRPPAKGQRPARGRVRWTRSSLVAASSGVVLCVLVAAVACTRMGGPSTIAASATGVPATTASATSPAGASATGTAPGSRPTKSSSSAPSTAAGGGKGVGIVAGSGVSSDLAESGASWYYNWSATPAGINTPQGVGFVPMIKTAADVNTATLSEVKQEGNYLLGFNEPDVGNEANMSVSTALSLWPQLEATGMQLGSPAVSYGTNSTSGWIGQFMQGARERGYRVNFITVHWYGQHHWTNPATNVNDLKSYLEETYNLYHLPIWITEFSLINFTGPEPVYPTQAQQAAFLTAATQMLATLPYVQRYAWYTLTGAHDGGTTILYPDGSTTATAVGDAFKKATP